MVVRFEPSGLTLTVPVGTTLFAAAKQVGLPVATACQAEGVCGRCGLMVLEGEAALSPATFEEHRVKAANRVPDSLRLSCLAEIYGDVVVTAMYW